MSFMTVYETLEDDLAVIEEKIEEVLISSSPTLQNSAVHYLRSGGKRLRPMLVLLCAKYGDDRKTVIKNVACALELIHMASLIHDDVIDDAETRRGRMTVKEKWDNKVAMYTGDYILAKSLELLTQLEDPEAHKLFAHTMVQLSIGEIEQIRDKYNFNQPIIAYFRRIKRKTALLIAACCKLGAMAAGCDRNVAETLYRFGYYAGMAFQITDDILDFVATEKTLGKPAGEDLLQGNITLPVFFALRNEQLKRQIMQVHGQMERQELEEVIRAIKASGAIKQAYAVCEYYIKRAEEMIDNLPAHPVNSYLRKILQFIAKRDH